MLMPRKRRGKSLAAAGTSGGGFGDSLPALVGAGFSFGELACAWAFRRSLIAGPQITIPAAMPPTNSNRNPSANSAGSQPPFFRRYLVVVETPIGSALASSAIADQAPASRGGAAAGDAKASAPFAFSFA